jgi:hypothetical protein
MITIGLSMNMPDADLYANKYVNGYSYAKKGHFIYRQPLLPVRLTTSPRTRVPYILIRHELRLMKCDKVINAGDKGLQMVPIKYTLNTPSTKLTESVRNVIGTT